LKIQRCLIYCVLFSIGSCYFSTAVQAQNFLQNSQIHGNFQADVMYYTKDSLIGAPDVPEKLLMNGFTNIVYTNGSFSAGIRYENYMNALLGFDKSYKGNGITYRYASFTRDKFEITAGNFYEQFGNGLIFRSYEERNLGFDNAMDGIRVKYTPVNGITLKAVYGYQRFFFDKGEGIVRGGDIEISVNDVFKKMNDMKTRFVIGGSVISKYQDDKDDPVYNLPENVAAFAGRGNLVNGGFNLGVEYAYKINDPNASNNRIYKPGEALLVQATYSRKGFGVLLAAKRIDNMDFRSDRTAVGNALIINFLPPLTKQHAYSLPSMYPYATQPNGEIGLEGQVIYTIKKKSKLGGKYGTTITVNYSRANSIDKQKVDDATPIDSTGTLGYKSSFFKIGKETYFEDFDFDISHKFSKHFKANLTYAYLTYNIDVIEGHAEGMLYAHTGILDMTYMITDKHSLRLELEYLYTKQDDHEWAMGLLEYSIAPKWFLAAMDSWNYGNPDPDHRIHYYNFSGGFIHGSSRIALSYGRQREGILCVGGVCRQVPAANGITLSLTSSF
jgi:hypothetical protein